MVTNVTSLIETNVTSKIKISSGKVGLKFRPSDKIKVKYYIRYVDSLRVGDRGGGGKKNKYVRTLKTQFSLHLYRRHPMLPD